MLKHLVRNGRFKIRGRRIMSHSKTTQAKEEDKSVEGGSVLGFMKRMKTGPLGASNMDATIKRNLQRTKEVLGNTVGQQQVITGGTVMDPLQSVSLPKFVGGKKVKRNNIKISF